MRPVGDRAKTRHTGARALLCASALVGAAGAAAPAPEADHWAFRPVVEPPVPEVADAGWGANPVDAFVLAGLERDGHGLRPAAPVGPAELLRRLHHVTTGLAPTYDEVEGFSGEAAAGLEGAVSRRVDDLLRSPQFGVRWARHWLDVARFADTAGYLFAGAERRFPFSYTYRDWVVDAFNADLPYDDFLRYQIAADRYVEAGDADRRHLAAMGFLTLGRRFLNNQHDIIDDRIDVVTRGSLGLTVACARCHDHKSDPVSTKDYYALYGVFSSSVEPGEKPLVGDPEPGPAHEEFLAKLAEIEREVQTYLEGKAAEARGADTVAKYLDAAAESWDGDRESRERASNDRGLYRRLVGRWVEFLGDVAAGDDPAAGPFREWDTFRRTAAGEGSESPAAEPEYLAGATDLASASATLGRMVAAGFDAGLAVGSRLPAGWDGLVTRAGAPPAAGPDEIRGYLHRQHREELANIAKKTDNLVATHPGSPPRGMVLVDSDSPADARVLERGNPGNPGAPAPRQFLPVLSPGGEPVPFKDGSGRRELAEAIVDPGNPLAARVMVNRVWAQVFGRPIVPTASDFGVGCPEPPHRELLDYLAARFAADGWSVKDLVRLLVTSSAFRVGAGGGEFAEADPDNELFGRMAPRRKDFEALRDAVLAAAGNLDPRTGGRSEEIENQGAGPGRRTLYAFVDRQNLPGVFRTFDFANPDSHSPGRHETTVPQQALYLMNSPFAIGQARAVTRLPGFGDAGGAAGKAAFIYRRLLAREPGGDELDAAVAFVGGYDRSGAPAGPPPALAAGVGGVPLDRWEQLAQAVMASNEFAFVD